MTLHTGELLLLDNSDYAWAAKHTWLGCLSMTTAGISIVAIARIDGKLVYLHEHILGLARDRGKAVAFIDGNTLNMQRANMYIVE